MKNSEGQEHFVAWSLKHRLSSHPNDNFNVGVPENPEIQCSYAKALYHFIRPWESVPSCDPEDQIVVLQLKRYYDDEFPTESSQEPSSQ